MLSDEAKGVWPASSWEPFFLGAMSHVEDPAPEGVRSTLFMPVCCCVSTDNCPFHWLHLHTASHTTLSSFDLALTGHRVLIHSLGKEELLTMGSCKEGFGKLDQQPACCSGPRIHRRMMPALGPVGEKCLTALGPVGEQCQPALGPG